MVLDGWRHLKPHDGQADYYLSEARFNVVPAGRGAGKTELAIRRRIERALGAQLEDHIGILAGPTHDQARHIFWEKLKRMSPREHVVRIREDHRSVRFENGAELWVVGLDKPERIEGIPGGIQDGVLDEYANMKADTWDAHVRPSLSRLDREGSMDFIGVPEGRNHFWELWDYAKSGVSSDWRAHHWTSEEILNPAEIEAAKSRLDPMLYDQEFLASFISFQGLAYYNFDRDVHAKARLEYDAALPLLVGLDFNRSPGVAVIAQEQRYDGDREDVASPISAYIGEVHIPRDSNTPMVCRKLIEGWGHHEGPVYMYGDPTGGNRGTAKIQGSDWDLVRQELGPVFGNRLRFYVDKRAGPERPRVNALNNRLRTTDGKVHLLIDPVKCPELVRDFEAVTVVEGGSGELNKNADKRRWTHLTDAGGYLELKRHPMVRQRVIRTALY